MGGTGSSMARLRAACPRLGRYASFSNRQGETHHGALFFFKQKTAYEISTDWSSDVCSSDLPRTGDDHGCRPARGRTGPSGLPGRRPGSSEERRVGKECRSRWSPDHYKKKGALRTDISQVDQHVAWNLFLYVQIPLL